MKRTAQLIVAAMLLGFIVALGGMVSQTASACRPAPDNPSACDGWPWVAPSDVSDRCAKAHNKVHFLKHKAIRLTKREKFYRAHRVIHRAEVWKHRRQHRC